MPKHAFWHFGTGIMHIMSGADTDSFQLQAHPIYKLLHRRAAAAVHVWTFAYQHAGNHTIITMA